MKKKTIEFKIERTITSSPGEVFDRWLDPKVPGNPWIAADRLLLSPKVDGFSTGLSGNSALWALHSDRAAGSN